VDYLRFFAGCTSGCQDDRAHDEQEIGLWHFWTMFVFFNLTFFPMFIIGLLANRVVSSLREDLQT